MQRTVSRIVEAQPTSDGAGVRLNRVIGTRQLDQLDPFLLLDEFRSDRPGDYLAGFPDHPHRGFETVTYMLAGRMRHADSAGNRGLLSAGSVQWMTAGRGIIHSEMPEQHDGLMWGFQLWVNLPSKAKMCAPRYQDIPPESVPVARPAEGVAVHVLAGACAGAVGPVRDIVTAPTYLDVRLEPEACFDYSLPSEHTAFAYVYDGAVVIGPDRAPVERGHLAVLRTGDELRVVSSPRGGRLILLAATPIREPVARYGPFVMNRPEEIVNAFRDYESGRLGNAEAPAPAPR